MEPCARNGDRRRGVGVNWFQKIVPAGVQVCLWILFCLFWKRSLGHSFNWQVIILMSQIHLAGCLDAVVVMANSVVTIVGPGSGGSQAQVRDSKVKGPYSRASSWPGYSTSRPSSCSCPRKRWSSKNRGPCHPCRSVRRLPWLLALVWSTHGYFFSLLCPCALKASK